MGRVSDFQSVENSRSSGALIGVALACLGFKFQIVCPF